MAVGQALSIRFRLGEFDPDGGRYGKIGPDVINSPAHQRLARETAAKAMVLLKNQGNALPLKPGGKVAVVGPLSDTLYTDWYGGHAPVPGHRPGRDQRASGFGRSAARARTGSPSRSVDTGRYVTAPPTPTRSPRPAILPRTAAQFDTVDWGQDTLTLRNVANGKYLGYNWGPFVTHDDQPTGWFVQQQFKLEAQADGTYVIRYAGYETQESWFGPNTLPDRRRRRQPRP